MQHHRKAPKSMAIISIIFFLFSVLVSSTHPHRNHPYHSIKSSSDLIIHQACKATRYPQQCESSLTPVYSKGTPMEMVKSAITLSAQNIRQAESMVRSILEASVGKINQTIAANNCIEHLHNSAYRLRFTADDLSRNDTTNGRAWTSAALSYQYDCWSALKYVNDTSMINETMSFMNNTLIVSTSNALSMMMAYDLFGDETAVWVPPRTEREGFWEGGGGDGGGTELGVPAGLRADVRVCKGGGCDYETVQAAVDAAPDWGGGGRRFVVWVKAGVYEETVRVGLEKQNVVVLGEGMGKTVITGSLRVGQPGLSTYNTATFDGGAHTHGVFPPAMCEPGLEYVWTDSTPDPRPCCEEGERMCVS